MGRWLVAGNGRQALMATSSEQHDERQPVKHQRTGIMQEPMDRQALVARQVPVGRPASVSRWAFAGRSVASTGSHSSMADTGLFLRLLIRSHVRVRLLRTQLHFIKR